MDPDEAENDFESISNRNMNKISQKIENVSKNKSNTTARVEILNAE